MPSYIFLVTRQQVHSETPPDVPEFFMGTSTVPLIQLQEDGTRDWSNRDGKRRKIAMGLMMMSVMSSYPNDHILIIYHITLTLFWENWFMERILMIPSAYALN